MTERDWPTSTVPSAMLRLAADRISDRKLRLYISACCRRAWAAPHDDIRRLVRAAEQYADGRQTEGQLEDARRPVHLLYGETSRMLSDIHLGAVAGAALAAASTEMQFKVWRQSERFLGRSALQDPPGRLDQLATVAGWRTSLADGGGDARRDIAVAQERAAQADLLRCVLGDPFTVTVPDPGWLTDAVLGLARTIYDRRDFAALPILADALEEAGCEDADLLAHCRHGREHARGCWAVDLLLGRS